MSASLPILLVACNQRNLDLLSQFLIKSGYITKCVQDLRGFERILENSVEFGLALVDISGFNRDIWKYCEILSSQGVPLVMIAPQRGQQIQSESLAHGAKGVLYKPLVIKELVVAVSELFGGLDG